MIAVGLGAVCAACTPQPSELTVHIGMSASELNAQPAILGRFKPNTEWIGHNGPLNLHLILRGHTIDIPVSGSNGGLQLSAWRGIRAEYAQPRLDTVVATVEPQGLTWDQAFVIAQKLCTQARATGLTIHAGADEPNTDRNEMNGVPACTIRDDVQSFDARIVPLGRPPTGKYRVEVAVQAHFDI